MQPIRAQATIEYLIVLAIATMLSLIALVFLGFFPNFSYNIEFREADVFWKDQARPFTAVDSYYQAATRRGYLALENMEPETLVIKGIFFNDTQASFYLYNTSPNIIDGVGLSYCNQSSCGTSPCNCSLSLPGRAMQRIVTESFMSADEICGIGGSEGKVPFRINYTRPSPYNGNFIQSGNLQLALRCLR